MTVDPIEHGDNNQNHGQNHDRDESLVTIALDAMSGDLGAATSVEAARSALLASEVHEHSAEARAAKLEAVAGLEARVSFLSTLTAEERKRCEHRLATEEDPQSQTTYFEQFAIDSTDAQMHRNS